MKWQNLKCSGWSSRNSLGNTRHPTNSWITILSDKIIFPCFQKRRVTQKSSNVGSSNAKSETPKKVADHKGQLLDVLQVYTHHIISCICSFPHQVLGPNDLLRANEYINGSSNIVSLISFPSLVISTFDPNVHWRLEENRILQHSIPTFFYSTKFDCCSSHM